MADRIGATSGAVTASSCRGLARYLVVDGVNLRRALRRWLSTPSAPPQFESEAMVKFFFSDQGSLDDATHALDELIAYAAELRDVFRKLTIAYALSPGPFPERIHITATRGRFNYYYAELLQQWASFARSQVESWPETGPAAAPFGTAVHRENTRLAGLEIIDSTDYRGNPDQHGHE